MLRTLAFVSLSPLVALLAVLVPLATAFVDVRAYAALTKSGEGRAQVDVIEGETKLPDCIDAIAWRDFVPAEQRLGSRVFTELELRRGIRGHRYARATYVTSTIIDAGRGSLAEAFARADVRGCAVDLFLLENAGGFVEGGAQFADLGVPPRDLRLVYDTGGGGSRDRLRRYWRDQLGATHVVTHGDESSWGNVAPIFYVFFLSKLADGAGIDDAVTSANEHTHTVLTMVGLDESMWRDTRAQLVTSTRPTSPSRSTF